MSGWMTGWLRGSSEADQSAAAAATSAAAPTSPAPAESAAEIREKRLRRLEATTAAAAAAAAAAASSEEATTTAVSSSSSRPASARPVPATTPTGASSKAVRPTTAAPTRSALVTATSPPASPATSKPPPISPLSAALAALETGRPAIRTLAPSAYVALRSSLPNNLLLGYGSGVPSDALLRAWENAALTEIFAVRVTDGASKAAHRTLLPELASELKSSRSDAESTAAAASDEFVEEPMQVHRAHLDTIVMERLAQFAAQPAPPVDTSSSAHHSGGAFAWMIASYRRALGIDERLQTGLAAATSSGATPTTAFPAAAAEFQLCIESVTLARTCIVRYTGLLLSDEEMFQTAAHRASARAECLRLLCSDSNVARTLPAGMLDSLVQTYAEEESFVDIFRPLADHLALPVKFAPTQSRMGEAMPTLEDASRQLHGLVQMFRFASTAQLVTSHPSWLPRVPSGRLLMTVSTLGPLLSLCAASTEAGFQQVLNNKPQYEVENEVTRLRASFTSYQALCAQLFRNGIKHPSVRESLLQWFAALVRSNIPRGRMQFHPLEVSSDGVMINSCLVALKLSQPIIKKVTKADFLKVNLNYLLQTSGGRIDYDAITRVQATLADVKAMRSGLATPIIFTPLAAPFSPFNFVTEIFFLSHEILHEGLASIVRKYTELMQVISRESRHLQREDPSSPMYAARLRQLDDLFAMNLATRVYLQDPTFVVDTIAFYDWTSRWIRHHQIEAEQEAKTKAEEATDSTAASGDATTAATSATTATTTVASPSSSSSSSLYRLIPETIVEDIVEYFIYLGRFQPQQLSQMPSSAYAGILDLVLALAAGPYALKNPHLRASLAEFLVTLLPVDGDRRATPDHVFATHPAMIDRLVPTLLELYVSVEDGRGMYYQKFTARNHISTLLEFVWQLPSHRAALLAVAGSGGALFTKFINMLANDLIFLLDDGLKELTKIREVQVEMANEQQWQSQTSEVRAERERAFAQSEQGATSCMTLANATVHMLFYLTAEIVAPFVAPEFVERVAHMLNYYIMQLVGDKISSLKVENREKYAFKPRNLLQEIIGIWLHLAHEKEFLVKVATDERSYRPALFAKAGRIMRHRAIMHERSILRFERLNVEVEQLSESLTALDEILGDLPDEYTDALMGTLMTDPVELPQSHQVVDRANIRRQLMNKKVDPFSNTPLTEEMLIEKAELKAEIIAWVEARKQAWREEKKKKEEQEGGGPDEDDEEEEEQKSGSQTATTAAAAASSTAAPPARKSYIDDDDE